VGSVSNRCSSNGCSMVVSSGNRCSSNRCSNSGCSNMSVSSGCSDGMVGNSMGLDSNGLVDGDVVLVNDGGLDNLVDGVNLVGLGDSIGSGDLNGVGFGNMFLNNDFSLNWDGHGDRDLNGVFVHFKLGFNTGNLRGNVSVGPDGGSDSGDGNGVSGCRSLVGGCRGDGSIRCRCSRDCWGSNGHGALGSLGGLSDVGVSRCLADLRVLSVGVSSLDSLGTNLDSSVSNNFMGGVGLDRSSMDVFLD